MWRCVLALLVLSGCASNAPDSMQEKPATITTLAGGPWLVEDINGGGVIDNARLEMTFADHRVSGRSGCNNFGGNWTQDGEAIKSGPFMTTRMACAPALMMLEGKFLKTLEAVRTVTFDVTGAALLQAPDGGVIKIRQESP